MVYPPQGTPGPAGAAPTAHKASHQDAGSDEISVAGLSGELADVQPPKITTLTELAAADIVGADQVPVYDASAAAAKKFTATSLVTSLQTGGALALSLAASQTGSGTFADARISSSSVTQWRDAMLTLASGDTITADAGVNIVLQPPAATEFVIARQPGGVAGTDDIRLYHDGTDAFIRGMSGNLTLTSANSLGLIISTSNAAIYPNDDATTTLGFLTRAWRSLRLGDAAAPSAATNHGILYQIAETGVSAYRVRFETNDVRIGKDIAAVALTQTYATADATLAALTVGADIAAFTDPPSAAEMATLRTFVNALKADHADLAQFVNSFVDAIQAQTTFIS